MFKINGTKKFAELLYPLSISDMKTFYKEYYDIWETAY